MKIKSVEGIEYEIEGPAEHLYKTEPGVSISIVPIDAKGEVMKKTAKGAKTVFIVVIKDKEVVFEERQNFN